MSQSSTGESGSPAGPKCLETRKQEEKRRREVVVVTGKKIHTSALAAQEWGLLARAFQLCQTDK